MQLLRRSRNSEVSAHLLKSSRTPARNNIMADEERKDIQTRFKKGRSGNPKGRPGGRKNNAGLLSDAFFKNVRIKDAQGVRSVPTTVAAAEVCLNNALKGDLRSFAKAMEIGEKFGVLKPGSIPQDVPQVSAPFRAPKDTPTGQQKW